MQSQVKLGTLHCGFWLATPSTKPGKKHVQSFLFSWYLLSCWQVMRLSQHPFAASAVHIYNINVSTSRCLLGCFKFNQFSWRIALKAHLDRTKFSESSQKQKTWQVKQFNFFGRRITIKASRSCWSKPCNKKICSRTCLDMSGFGVFACVSKQGLCEKQQQFNLHCHYTDGQKRVVSVQRQRLFGNILNNILTTYVVTIY